MALCDVQTLMNSAACFACLPPGTQQIIELQLLCEILNAGGGSGGNPQVFQGHGAPSGLQAGQVAGLAALYTDVDNGVLYTWSIDGQNWF